MAPQDTMPVTREVITWARRRAGYTIVEAESDFAKIAEWEGGDSFPSYPQLERMADKFKCPIAVFFFPEPPATEPIGQSFRTLPEQEFERIPREIQVMLRKGKAMQLNLTELSNGQSVTDRLITHDINLNVDESLDDMAARVRDYLGVSLDEQFRWRTIEDALENWRSSLSDVGLFVFKEAFRVDEFSGFCLYDEQFPIIYVNNGCTKSRQIFTLFHELTHLLFKTSGIDVTDLSYPNWVNDEAEKIEIICNRFASRFLVPDGAFSAALAGQLPSTETAERLAQQFSVSREVICRKFLDRALITEAEYLEASQAWTAQAKGTGSGGNYYYTQIAYLGKSYINLVLSHYYQNRFDEVQLAGYLNIKPKNVSKFEDTYTRIMV